MIWFYLAGFCRWLLPLVGAKWYFFRHQAWMLERALVRVIDIDQSVSDAEQYYT